VVDLPPVLPSSSFMEQEQQPTNQIPRCSAIMATDAGSQVLRLIGDVMKLAHGSKNLEAEDDSSKLINEVATTVLSTGNLLLTVDSDMSKMAATLKSVKLQLKDLEARRG
jgi:hypothetical protein